MDPALELRGEHQEDQQQRHPEGQPHRAAGLQIVARRAAPAIVDAAGLGLDLVLEELHRLAHRVAGVELDGEGDGALAVEPGRSEEHTSELQSLMRISYAVFCLNKKKQKSSIRLYRGVEKAQTE